MFESMFLSFIFNVKSIFFTKFFHDDAKEQLRIIYHLGSCFQKIVVPFSRYTVILV